MYGSNLNKRGVFNNDIDNSTGDKNNENDVAGDENSNNIVVSTHKKKKRKLRSNIMTNTLSSNVELARENEDGQIIQNGDTITTLI